MKLRRQYSTLLFQLSQKVKKNIQERIRANSSEFAKLEDHFHSLLENASTQNGALVLPSKNQTLFSPLQNKHKYILINL
jgi:hypothetical protein